jgi:hypothetical protein
MPFFALAVIPYFAKLTKLTYFLVAKLGKLPLAKLQLREGERDMDIDIER